MESFMFLEKQLIRIDYFLANAYLKYQNNIDHIYEVYNKKKLFVLIQKAHLTNIFFGKYEEEKEFAILFISIENDYVDNFLQNSNFELIKKIFIKENMYNDFINFLNNLKISLTFAFLEISTLKQEKNSGFQIGEFYSAGYPPLILLQNGNIIFPVRSGIPFGINQMLPKKQTLEIPLSSRFYIHTPLNEREHNLKELHYLIIKSELESVPKDLILFEYNLTNVLNV